LDLLYPEVCLFCHAEYGEVPWSGRGSIGCGVSWYDGPHICRECSSRLAPNLVRGTLPVSCVPVVGGLATNPDLVAAISHWKYHGVRGLAWPLSSLLRPVVTEASGRFGAVDSLVPIPLHRGRRRARGFNQAEVLARLAGPPGLKVQPCLLERQRATGQQAKLASEEARRVNLKGAFVAPIAAGGQLNRRIGLIDDLVTGGMTCEAAIEALAAAGWRVVWVACLGLSVPKKTIIRGQVDSPAAEI